MPGGPSRRQLLLGAAALAAGCTSSRRPPTASPSPSAGPPRLPRIRGRVLTPATPGYPHAARLYNPRYDGTHPLAVARCADEQDVVTCVRWATETGTPLHVRAGGHSYGGWSSGAGLVVDLRDLDEVRVAGASASVGGGALLAPVYAGLAARGRALAAGSCPTVGFSGLALGGGVGVLTRAYGLTCDAVSGARVVLADGTAHDADDDLLWALKGGGGSFGIVTSWQVRTHSAPTVVTFYLAWDLSRGTDVLDAWQGWAHAADRRLWSTCKLLVSADRERALVAGTWLGPRPELEQQLTPLLRTTGSPRTQAIQTRTYGEAMLFEAGCAGLTTTSCVSGALSAPKRQPFAATSAILASPLPTTGVEAALSAVRRGRDVAGMAEGGLSFDALGGAVGDVAPDATAFPWRQAIATVQATATWTSGSPQPYDDHVQAMRTALVPFTGEAAYSNYADPSLTDYASAYWGDNLARLQATKRQLDPHDLFHWQQSIRG